MVLSLVSRAVLGDKGSRPRKKKSQGTRQLRPKTHLSLTPAPLSRSDENGKGAGPRKAARPLRRRRGRRGPAGSRARVRGAPRRALTPARSAPSMAPRQPHANGNEKFVLGALEKR